MYILVKPNALKEERIVPVCLTFVISNWCALETGIGGGASRTQVEPQPPPTTTTISSPHDKGWEVYRHR